MGHQRLVPIQRSQTSAALLQGWFAQVMWTMAALSFGTVLRPAMAQPSGAHGNDFLYRVQQGDTLSAIALRYLGEASACGQLAQHPHDARAHTQVHAHGSY